MSVFITQHKFKAVFSIIVLVSGVLLVSSYGLFDMIPAQAAVTSTSYPDAMTIHFDDGTHPTEVSQFNVPPNGNESVCNPAPAPWDVQWSGDSHTGYEYVEQYVPECNSGDTVYALYPFSHDWKLVPGPSDQTEQVSNYQICQDENGFQTRYCTWDEVKDINSTDKSDVRRWSQMEGPSVNLTGANSLYPTFIAPDVSEPTHLKFKISTPGDSVIPPQTDVYDILVKPKDTTFNIKFSSFIPANNVKAPPQFSCYSTIEHKRVSLYFAGDDRNYDPNSNSFRARQMVSVVTGSDSDGIKDGTTPQNLVGTSRAYAEDAVKDDGKIDPADDDATLNDCHLLHQVATASNGDMHIDVQKLSDKKTQVHLYGSATLPFKPEAPASGAAAVDWDFTIVIDTGGKSPSWTLIGKHDGFPAYEIYINNKPIYQNGPGPGPYTLSQVLKLYPPMDVSVSKGSIL